MIIYTHIYLLNTRISRCLCDMYFPCRHLMHVRSQEDCDLGGNGSICINNFVMLYTMTRFRLLHIWTLAGPFGPGPKFDKYDQNNLYESVDIDSSSMPAELKKNAMRPPKNCMDS